MTARSALAGMSRTDLYAFLPNTVSLVGLIGYTLPLKPCMMLEVMVAPTLPFLSDAPMTAMALGDRNEDVALTDLRNLAIQ